MESDEEKPQVCGFCYLVFDPVEFANHDCREKKPFVCQACFSAFDNEEEIKEHIREHHEDKDVEKVFTQVEMDQSGEGWNGDMGETKPVVCDLCYLSFMDDTSFARHMEEEHNVEGINGENHVMIKQEQTIAPLVIQPEEESLTEVKEEMYSCHVCGGKYTSKYSFDLHVNTHSVVGVFPCELCEKKFSGQSYLDAHVAKMHKDKYNGVNGKGQFKCKVCGEKFNTIALFVAHSNVHKVNAQKLSTSQNVCDKCGIKFKDLFKHKMHCNKKKQICRFCSKLCHSEEDYEEHLKIHEDKAPIYSCTECDERFRGMALRDKHFKAVHGSDPIVVQTESKKRVRKTDAIVDTELKKRAQNANIDKCAVSGIRQFKCGVCGKKFNTMAQFVAHNSVHEVNSQQLSTSQNVCGNCGIKFMASINLLKHEIHCNKRKQICRFCSKLCDSQLDYVKHLKTHKDEEPIYSCTECNQMFRGVAVRDKHFKAVHGTETILVETGLNKIALKTDGKTGTGSKKRAQKRNVMVAQFEDKQPNSLGHFCHFCQKIFREKAQLDEHLRIAHMASPYVCSMCPRMFQEKILLNAHLSTHKHKHTCKLCGASFSNALQFNDHMGMHKKGLVIEVKGESESTKQDALQCTICGNIFVSPEKLEKHMLVHDETTGEETCDVCFDKFKKKTELRLHKLYMHSGARRYHHCARCSISFNYPGPLQDHIKERHSDWGDSAAYYCEFCGKFFNHKESRRQHILNTHTEKEFKCEHCEMSYRWEPYLINHISKQHCDKKLMCGVCFREFPYKSNLTSHMKEHGSNNPEQCSYCYRYFPNCADKEEHETLIHSEEIMNEIKIESIEESMEEETKNCESSAVQSKKETHKCALCSETFVDKESLKEHMEEDHDASDTAEEDTDESMEGPDDVEDDDLTCDTCYKTFMTKSSFNRHLLTHKGKGQLRKLLATQRKVSNTAAHKCKICKKTFSTRRGLNKHMETHNKFECDHCGNKFNTRKDLEKHAKEHAVENPFKCEECDKSFFRNADLSKHIATHVLNQVFECDQCDKIFLKKAYYHQHCKTHAPKFQTFECGICDEKFPSSVRLRQHGVLKHNLHIQMDV